MQTVAGVAAYHRGTMHCPTCGDEYRSDLLLCSDCGVALVPEHAGPTLQRLGRFHPELVAAVVGVAGRRSDRVETITRDDGVDVLVEGAARDELRAELVLTWERLLAGLDGEALAELRRRADDLPGWLDPPESLWVDRAGTLQAGWTREEIADQERSLGPALMAIGGLLLVTAWYVGDDSLRLTAAVFGVGILLFGWFMPR